VTFAEGQEIVTEGTACSNSVCKCRTRDCYVPIGDGTFCRSVQECAEGQERLSEGVC